jgi:hypothetical protein
MAFTYVDEKSTRNLGVLIRPCDPITSPLHDMREKPDLFRRTLSVKPIATSSILYRCELFGTLMPPRRGWVILVTTLDLVTHAPAQAEIQKTCMNSNLSHDPSEYNVLDSAAQHQNASRRNQQFQELNEAVCCAQSAREAVAIRRERDSTLAW